MAKGRQSSGDMELFRASQKSTSRTSHTISRNILRSTKELTRARQTGPPVPYAVSSSVKDAVPYEPDFIK